MLNCTLVKQRARDGEVWPVVLARARARARATRTVGDTVAQAVDRGARCGDRREADSDSTLVAIVKELEERQHAVRGGLLGSDPPPHTRVHTGHGRVVTRQGWQENVQCGDEAKSVRVNVFHAERLHSP